MEKKLYKKILIAVIIIFIAIGVAIPNILENNKKINTISQWKNIYRNIEYFFSAIKTQRYNINSITNNASLNNKQKEKILFDLLNPYFKMSNNILSNEYQIKYMNGNIVEPNDIYYITNFYTTDNGNIVGIKWLNFIFKPTKKKYPIAILTYDLNGTTEPNSWGKDIFGINIYPDQNIEPIGKISDENSLKKDCSYKGKGLACSYYYYIYGGKLD